MPSYHGTFDLKYVGEGERIHRDGLIQVAFPLHSHNTDLGPAGSSLPYLEITVRLLRIKHLYAQSHAYHISYVCIYICTHEIPHFELRY